MRGLDPRIHQSRTFCKEGWIAGSSPAMTIQSKNAARNWAAFDSGKM
jgi:hypothetical protein